MYDAAKYTDHQLQQQRASINTTSSLYDSPNDVTITNYRYFGRQTLADDGSAESARNGSRSASMATNGWHRESDRQPRSPTGPKSYDVSSLTNGIQPSTSMKHLTSPFDDTSRNASSGASATDQRHRMTSSTSINGNNGVNKIAMNSSAKTSPNGLRLNFSSFNKSDFITRRASPSQSNDSSSGGRATADNSTPTSGHDGFIDDIEAQYPTDGVTTTTTASTASSSSPGCETPGDESHFLAAAAKPRTSLEGRYRIVSLADQYFPVTFGGECGVNKDGRTVRGRASSASEAATADSASTRRLNGRTQSHHHRHHHQHRRRHQHRQVQHEHGLNNGHHSRQPQPQSQRRPGSGHSSSSSRSATSSVDVIYGSVSAVVSSSGDVITLNGGSTVLTSTPYQTELTRLRVDRLRIEEERMAQLTALKKVEISRGPVAKWYELKSPQFHYEAHKNNRQIGAMTDSESPFGVGRLWNGINGSISRTSPAAVTGVSAVTRSSFDV